MTGRKRTLLAGLLRAGIAVIGLAVLFACAARTPGHQRTPHEILSGAIRTDIEWGASTKDVVSLLRERDITYYGPKEDKNGNATIEAVLDPLHGSGCRPVTQILFRFKAKRGLYDIHRSATTLCGDL